jgi:hypothetical protein
MSTKNDLHETIRKLLNGKEENNHLFFYSGRFHVMRANELRLVSEEAADSMFKANKDLITWQLELHDSNEKYLEPELLKKLRPQIISVVDVDTYGVLIRLLT